MLVVLLERIVDRSDIPDGSLLAQIIVSRDDNLRHLHRTNVAIHVALSL